MTDSRGEKNSSERLDERDSLPVRRLTPLWLTKVPLTAPSLGGRGGRGIPPLLFSLAIASIFIIGLACFGTLASGIRSSHSPKAPKERNSIAWGNAPGDPCPIPSSPERASLRAGRGLAWHLFRPAGAGVVGRCSFPGRCPGLFHPAPSGLRTFNLVALATPVDQRTSKEWRAARAVARGQDLFLHYCGPCHGPMGKGDGKFFATGLEPKPTDLSDESYRRARTETELFQWIGEGSGAAGRSLLCPPWGKTLDEEQIRELVAFVQTLASKAKSEGSAPPDETKQSKKRRQEP